MTAVAGNRHANSAGQLAGVPKAGAITTLTTGAMLEVKAQDDESKAQQAALDAAKAQAAAAAQAQAQAQVAPAQTDEQDNEDAQDNNVEQDNDDQGDGSD
jgi:hypothetical protein